MSSASNPLPSRARSVSYRKANFPIILLIEISQTLAALTTIRFPASAIAPRATSPRRGSPMSHQMNACVSRSRSTSGIVTELLQQFRRKRRVEIVGHVSDPKQVHRLARLLLGTRDGHKLRHRLAVLGDDDLFARGSAIDQR